jgi:hypothetical protein
MALYKLKIWTTTEASGCEGRTRSPKRESSSQSIVSYHSWSECLGKNDKLGGAYLHHLTGSQPEVVIEGDTHRKKCSLNRKEI